MLVLHFSTTPLAGMPIRLVQALNRHTQVTARLVDTRRFGIYDHDVVFEETPEEALALAEAADVIHLHNYLDYSSTAFAPIDFAALATKGIPIVRQFHSTPELVAQVMGISPKELLAQDIPCLSIAQYPERLYPKAMVVPNFVPETQPSYLPGDRPSTWDIFYSHTKDMSAWADRWSTKGMPEIVHMLDGLTAATGCRVRVATGRPLAEVLAEKRRSRMVVDDLVTGSYHLTGMEGLAQAKPVLARLDGRSLELLRYFSGVDVQPFINVRLEDAPEALKHLLEDPELCRELGRSGREWLTTHWSEATMIDRYVDVYELLLKDPALVRRQPELSLEPRARYFMAKTLPDLIHKARKRAHTGRRM